MTAQPNVVFKVVKGNPTDADVAAIGEALRTLAFAASTDTMPESSSALDNWGSVKRQFTPIVAYSPTAYSNNSLSVIRRHYFIVSDLLSVLVNSLSRLLGSLRAIFLYGWISPA